MTRFEDRTPRRRRGLKRQRRNEYAGMVVRIYRNAVLDHRKGGQPPSEQLISKVRTLIKGEPIEDQDGQPSTLTESARNELIREFMTNGMTLDPTGDSKADAC